MKAVLPSEGQRPPLLDRGHSEIQDYPFWGSPEKHPLRGEVLQKKGTFRHTVPKGRVSSNKGTSEKGHSDTRSSYREEEPSEAGPSDAGSPKESRREQHQRGQAEARVARGTGSRGPRQRRRPRTHRSCSAPYDRQLGPGPASGRTLGSGRVASQGDGSLGWRLRRLRRQDDGRPTDRLRGARTLRQRGCACARRGADPGRKELPRRTRSRSSVSPLLLTLKLPASQPGFPGC